MIAITKDKKGRNFMNKKFLVVLAGLTALSLSACDKGNDNTIYIDATQWWLINRSTNLNATLFVWDAGQKQKQG